jgi:hypothetical protein
MFLKLTLKPGEPVHVGRARISVLSTGTAQLLIEGHMPILRHNLYLEPEEQETELDRFVGFVQEIYLGEGFGELLPTFLRTAMALGAQYPEFSGTIAEITLLLMGEDRFEAVRLAREMRGMVMGRTLLSRAVG